MKFNYRKLLFPVFVLGLFFLFADHVQAQSISYHTYKYGTHQTSMADGYYARPAQIVADGKQYLVTMTIRTKKNLSPYPVKVLTIDGQTPLNVEKTRHGSDYDYRYSFRTDNLNRDISSKISIDVPNVYKATHEITFRFDTNNLPKLSGKKSKQAKSSTTTSTNKSKGDNGSALLAQAQRQSKEAKEQEDALAKQKLKQNQKNQQENARNQRMFYYLIAGGIICLLILIVAAVFFVLSVKNIKSKKDK